MFNKRKMDLVHNPLTDSIFNNDNDASGPPIPPVTGEFLILDGTNFLLLNGTDFNLL